MATETLPAPETKLPDGYPFHIGRRLINHRDAEGNWTGAEYVPLTEEDFLHPQEEDRFMVNDAHTAALIYLKQAIEGACRNRDDIRVFADHRIDWQIDGIDPHGPDVVVFRRFTVAWDTLQGTVPVKDVGAEVIAIFEATSPSTRTKDVENKFEEYAAVGVPYYFIVDLADPDRAPNLRGYRLVRNEYVPIRYFAGKGCRIPDLKLSFRLEEANVIASGDDGRDIPGAVENLWQLDDLRELAEFETDRADHAERKAEAEAARAEAEAAKAKAEAARADALAQELAELKAKLNEAQ